MVAITGHLIMWLKDLKIINTFFNPDSNEPLQTGMLITWYSATKWGILCQKCFAHLTSYIYQYSGFGQDTNRRMCLELASLSHKWNQLVSLFTLIWADKNRQLPSLRSAGETVASSVTEWRNQCKLLRFLECLAELLVVEIQDLLLLSWRFQFAF